MKILFEENELTFDELTGTLFTEKKVSVSIARLDKIHPEVSGNKLFKLHYFLQQAIHQKNKPVLTFGGAYSNHLAAVSYACGMIGLRSIAMVRGERQVILSHTLKQCELNGMELNFISRAAYSGKDSLHFKEELKQQFGDCMIIPEGGYHPLGADGASLIMDKLVHRNATHTCTAIGTATTIAGLVKNNPGNTTIIGIPVLKDMHDLQDRISYLCEGTGFKNPEIFDNFHFGGYAKKTKGLIHFMNDFFSEYGIPTDFVYTAKMMYAVMDKIRAGYFPEGSNIICLHTGGLQGNDSLEKSALLF